MQESSTDVAAERLRARKNRVLQRWLERVQEQLDAAKSTDRPELIDTIPEVLDRIAEALASTDPERDLEPAGAWLGAKHGKDRAALSAYSLEHLIIEARLLHDVLLDVLDEDGPIDRESRDVITHATLISIRNAVSEFARLRSAAIDSELLETNTRFRHMVEAVKDYAIFTISPQGVISTWNVGCIRMKRYTPEEAIGQHFSMLYTEEGRRRDEPMGHLRSAAIEGRYRGEGIRLRKGGDVFLADVSITPIFEGGTVIAYTKVVQDLTERNLLVQERDLSRFDSERLQAEQDYRAQFVASLTHDLRSPLAAASTAASLIANHADEPAKVAAWASKITSSLARADRMISDLLDSSRLDRDSQMELEFSHCDAQVIVGELFDEVRTRHGDRFELEVDGVTEGFWSADGLRRVFENLVSNAIKYGDPEGLITVRLKRVEDHLIASVHNVGSMIPLEEQQNVFRAYHRAPTARRSGQPGWGIGLALVKAIVEAHGGVVKAESYPKEGTIFTVDLPVDGAAAGRSLNRQGTST